MSDFFFETVEMIVKLDQQFFRYSPRENNRREKMRSLTQNFNELIQRLEGVDDEGIGAYLSFDVLNE